jgi:hypothetical protein
MRVKIEETTNKTIIEVQSPVKQYGSLNAVNGMAGVTVLAIVFIKFRGSCNQIERSVKTRTSEKEETRNGIALK